MAHEDRENAKGGFESLSMARSIQSSIVLQDYRRVRSKVPGAENEGSATQTSVCPRVSRILVIVCAKLSRACRSWENPQLKLLSLGDGFCFISRIQRR